MINPDDLCARFAQLEVWKANGQRAPHKPLLVLWAIGRCLRNESRMESYQHTASALRNLLGKFGPHRTRVHPEFPFWRLQNDGIWEVTNANRVSLSPSGDAHVSSLVRENVHGGFPLDVFDTLRSNEKLAIEIAYSLVEAHFPSSLQNEVLQAVGIFSKYEHVRRRARDGLLAESVLVAYGYKCSVCAFSVCLGSRPIALEAAHIRWHSSRGPDQINNALALCALHHRLFDAGAFTLSLDKRVIVAASAQGRGFEDALGRFNSEMISLPSCYEEQPDDGFVRWHQREVFNSLPISKQGEKQSLESPPSV